MAKKRSKIFATKYFGMIIGIALACFIALLSAETSLFQKLNVKVVDLHFLLKGLSTPTSIQEGVTVTNKNFKISDDLVIVGIDSKSLAKFGKWPFPRSIHSNFINSFSRIKDKKERESSLFLDVFIIEPDRQPADDARFVNSIAESKKVFMETVLDPTISDYESFPKMKEREQYLASLHPYDFKISGDWQAMIDNQGVQAPLKPFAAAISGFGHANYSQDYDEVYRRQALIAKFSVEEKQIPLSELTDGYKVDPLKFERLAWIDKQGSQHPIQTPLTASSLKALKTEVEKNAPPVVVDSNSDGVPENSYFIIRKYIDQFVPSITLALALEYFGVDPNNVEINIGKNIRIPNPTKLNPTTGERTAYTIPVGPDVYDSSGNLVKPAVRKVLKEIDIPINTNGEMLINFMGYRSSSSVDGYQTFPVRSYSAYADRVPGPDPDSWPRTKAVPNKILMVGPFADGIAQDEKPTPYGLMYGIEIHTNSLNTILMNNFLIETPEYFNIAILFILLFLLSIIFSRLPTPISMVLALISIIALFFALTFIFEYNNLIINFAEPSIGIALLFLSITSYRAMTEERDKKALRASFGKYVSPKVVDELIDNQPELGGVDKEITVFFSDIRGFTTLSENMTPQQLVDHLNEYLTAMTDIIILELDGTLDKYVGDEVMCFWGAPAAQPDHALMACRCALRQMEKLRELNEKWPASKRINIGIGLNSGIMTVGNMGSPGRMNYTLMGDNVNLGARLEGTNKEYGTNIIISEFTYGLVKDHFIVRELDNIRVKGKNKPVLIYELIAEK